MTPEQWRLVNQIFDHAADLPAAAQAAAVHELSRGEAVVESEVLRLLQSMRQAGDFLAAPLLDLHALLPDDLSPAPMFVPGAVILDRFHIRRFLASGGMGEVYEAWDNELEEDVALKTIRPQIARHPEVIERFKQEVRNARGISHPNICRVYEIFHVDAPGGERIWFLSMELVRGTTLLDCIHTKGCLPSADALLIARQMASGLEAAHQYGLVHRDFKSANVMLVEEASKPARAVIMDFGLSARMLQADAIDRHATAGTPGYMAPEQERGGTIGPLADQYAFGVVLCEMLSGALPTWRPAKAEGRRRSTLRGLIRPRQIAAPVKADVHENPQAAAKLEAQGNVAVLANGAAQSNAAVHEIVPVQGAPAGQVKAVPAEKPRLRLPPHRFSPRAEHVIRRCLDRDPACRFPDMKTAANTLVPPGILGTPWRKAMAACLLILLALGAWRWRVYQSRCRICDVVQLTPDTDQSESPSLSRDGKMIAYSSDRASSGNLDIFTQQLPDGQPVRLTRDRAGDGDPSISPDGSTVAFRSERNGGGIYIVDAHGGGQERLLVPGGRNPQISPDGKSLLYWTGDLDQTIASGRLYEMRFDSGKTIQFASGFADSRYPTWSPDGREILFTGCENLKTPLPSCSDWWVAEREVGRLVQTHALSDLVSRGILLYRFVTGTWVNHKIVFAAVSGPDQNLWSIPIEKGSWQVADAPTRLSSHNSHERGPSIADTGGIAYTNMAGAMHVWRTVPGQASSGNVSSDLEKVTDTAEVDHTPYVSEDGQYLVVVRGRTRRAIWLRDLTSGNESLVLHSDYPLRAPIIDQTGRWLAFEQSERGVSTVMTLDRSGGAQRKWCEGCDQPTSWFAEGSRFFFRAGSPSAIRMADLRDGSTRSILQSSTLAMGDASWSKANGRLLFTVTHDDHRQIFTVQLDSATAQPRGEWIAITGTTDSAHHPRWSSDGRTIFYASARDGFLSVYSQGFSPEEGHPFGPARVIASFHNQRRAIENVVESSFNMSTGAGSLYFNLGEQTSTIQYGSLSKSDR